MTDFRYGAAWIQQRAQTTTYHYQEVGHQEKRSGKCPLCGKRRTRQTTFTATQSPFNKDPETGQPRTLPQIRAVLVAKGADWEADFTCASHDEKEAE